MMDIPLISEGGEIMKIYFGIYNTPAIDLMLEYIGPLPWYCPRSGGDFFQAYATAGRALAEAGSKTKNTEDRNMSDAEKNMRKRANQKSNSNKSKKSDANDVWDMSDEDFEKERHSLMK